MSDKFGGIFWMQKCRLSGNLGNESKSSHKQTREGIKSLEQTDKPLNYATVSKELKVYSSVH